MCSLGHTRTVSNTVDHTHRAKYSVCSLSHTHCFEHWVTITMYMCICAHWVTLTQYQILDHTYNVSNTGSQSHCICAHCVTLTQNQILDHTQYCDKHWVDTHTEPNARDACRALASGGVHVARDMRTASGHLFSDVQCAACEAEHDAWEVVKQVSG